MTAQRILICDDEELGRERIRTLLKSRRDVEVTAEASDGREAVERLRTETFDLVFLDIQMPHLSGFEVVREIGSERMPPIVFVTAYDEYALRAFEVHALDYLLKPFEPERFYEALDRVLSIIQTKTIDDLKLKVNKLMDGWDPPADYLERIMIRSRQNLQFVNVADIDWIEAAGNYVELHTGRDSYLLRQTMTTLEQRLDPKRFARIHRSTIVNIDRIKVLRPSFSGDYEVCLVDGSTLTLSRSYRDILERFN